MFGSVLSRRLLSIATAQAARTLSGASPAKQYAPSVFVGGLDLLMKSDSLKKIVCSKFDGEIDSVRIVGEKDGAESRGFGFVTLRTDADAQKCFEALRDLEIDGKPAVVRLGKKEPTAPRPDVTLFVGGITGDVTEDSISALFAGKLGQDCVARVRFAKAIDGTFRGFAHVDFSSEEIRNKALAELQGIELNGQPLKVDAARRKDTPRSTVFIGNLSWDVTDAHMGEMLDEIVGKGSWSNLSIVKDKVTGNPRGFAFVDLQTNRFLNKSITELNGIEMFGRQLRAQLTVKKPSFPKKTSAPAAEEQH